MPDKRRARRESDPGLQPERTSLAWFRTLLGYAALMVLAIKHQGQQAGTLFWITLGVLAVATIVLWRYTRHRQLMDVSLSDFSESRSVRDKLLIALAVFALSVLFAASHVSKIILFFREFS
ncbi:MULTISPECIES: DUF202 domain-containing protein [Enterobacteriaceae]|uniref:DUF202 domain-containing protein n=1 Tax=Raoultella lignicola TaxID=3040939 RepID=A0ABU9F5Y8_9ENTR|nr:MULTISPECIES: DUF202 domain-containing protein [Enterobacteriaceae]MRT50185.1 DUF202 domain-containing protein [Raoultella sp. RIT712]QNK06762.1 DUF202 domain-containing protein [Enterobacter sp. JUb54]ROS09842.1 uncharacterized protein DUF202 [Raoultella sp. BIGb0399]